MRVRALLLAMSLALGAVAAVADPGAPMIEDEVAILRLEDRRAEFAPFLEFLESPRAKTRARACLALGRTFGPAPADTAHADVHAALATRLREDPSPEVRREAAFTLGLLQTQRAATALAACLVSRAERDPHVRAAAAEGLGRCGLDAHPAAMRIALADPRVIVIDAALLAVWKGSRPLHVDQILRLADYPNSEVRWRAAYALMRSLGAPPSGRTPVPGGARLSAVQRGAIFERMLALSEDPDVRVKLQALRVLGRLGDDELALHDRAVDALREATGHRDARVRVEALRGLGALLAETNDAPQITALLADPHGHVRITAIQAAGRVFATPALARLLVSALVSPSTWERAIALRALTDRAREEQLWDQTLHLIDRAADDTAWEVRYTAAELLADVWRVHRDSVRAGGLVHEVGGELLDALLTRFVHDDPKVAKAVVPSWVLTQEAQDLLSAIDPFLRSDDEILRTMTLHGLGECFAPETAIPGAESAAAAVLDRVKPLRNDPSTDVRGALITCLGALMNGGQRMPAAALLTSIATEDPERLIRNAAIDQLRSNVREDDPWRDRLDSLTAGPQATDWDMAAYRMAFSTAVTAREAVLELDSGALRIALLGRDAPLTVYNFVQLAERGYFDNGRWHRVVPDFVVQDGCPRGDGWGGPGHTIRCEINHHPYTMGAFGMALSGKDTGGSQFFLTLSEQPHLDGRYTVFGRLAGGTELMQRVGQGDVIRRVRIIYAQQ